MAQRERHYPPEYISKATRAYLLDCGDRTIDDYVARGVIPKGILIGTLRRWHWPSVREMLTPEQDAGEDIRCGFSEGIRRAKREHDCRLLRTTPYGGPRREGGRGREPVCVTPPPADGSLTSTCLLGT